MHKIDALQHFCKRILATKKALKIRVPKHIQHFDSHLSNSHYKAKNVYCMDAFCPEKKNLLDFQLTESSSFHFTHASLQCLYFSPSLGTFILFLNH